MCMKIWKVTTVHERKEAKRFGDKSLPVNEVKSLAYLTFSVFKQMRSQSSAMEMISLQSVSNLARPCYVSSLGFIRGTWLLPWSRIIRRHWYHSFLICFGPFFWYSHYSTQADRFYREFGVQEFQFFKNDKQTGFRRGNYKHDTGLSQFQYQSNGPKWQQICRTKIFYVTVVVRCTGVYHVRMSGMSPV